MKLSDRLQLIADEIHCGETMADIGTDHGFLPLYLLETKKCPKVIMADISSGSLAKAEENCKLAKAEGDYELRLGNGIDILEDGEVDVVAIAGMGGNLIADILEWNLVKSRSIKRYILQPRRHVGKLRHWLYCNGFEIVKESLVEEGKFICEILTVESRPAENSKEAEYSVEFDYPDSLLEHVNPMTAAYLQRKLALENMILDNINENSQNAGEEGVRCKARIDRINTLISRLEAQNA